MHESRGGPAGAPGRAATVAAVVAQKFLAERDTVDPHLERLREAEKRLYDGPGEEAGDVRAAAQRDARGG